MENKKNFKGIKIQIIGIAIILIGIFLSIMRIDSFPGMDWTPLFREGIAVIIIGLIIVIYGAIRKF